MRRGVHGVGARTGPDAIIVLTVYILVAASCMVVFVKAAAARIAPVTENRSTGLRWTMFFQQLLWIAVITFIGLWYEERESANFGTMIVGGYWLLMGTLTLGESPELSPRVQRQLPSTLAGRAMLTWFNPGPGTGFVFAISSGTVASVVLGTFGLLVGGRSARTDTLTFAALITGYLMAYLGITRLIVMPLNRRFGSSFMIPIITLAGVLGVAAVTPLIFHVLTTGAPPYDYQPLEAIDWAWTLVEAFEGRYDTSLAMTVLVVGLLVLQINLMLLFREFRYRRMTVPQRVLEDGRPNDAGDR